MDKKIQRDMNKRWREFRLDESTYEHINAEFDEMNKPFVGKVDSFLKDFDKWVKSEKLSPGEKSIAGDEIVRYIKSKLGIR